MKFLLQLRYLNLTQVLQLEALYQILNVVFEVPSGIFSDRLGRRPTLIISAACGAASCAAFFAGTGFWMFLLANALSAISASFQSGTDRAFHFDALEALGRKDEYQRRESFLHRDNLLIQSAFCVAGGLLGAVDLKLAFAAAGAAGLAALAAAVFMSEPPRKTEAQEAALWAHFREPVGALRAPAVAWVAAFAALASVLDHFPYQYYQPYLEQLSLSWAKSAAWPAGLHVAAAHVIGAGAAAAVPSLLARFAPWRLMLASSWVHLIMLSLAAAFVHPAIAVLLAFRELPNAVKSTLVAPLVLPRVSQRARATVLSLIAFASRLAVAAAVFGVSWLSAMPTQLWAAVAMCFAAWAALAAMRSAVSGPKS